MKIESINLGSGGVLCFTVKPSDGDSFTTTKEFLRNPDSPDIGWIPTTVSERKSSVANLPDEVIKSMTNPVNLSPLQEEFLKSLPEVRLELSGEVRSGNRRL